MKNDKLFAFSILTGQVFKIEQDELKLLFPYQIPLTNTPNKHCKKCYGRGYTAIDSKNKFHIMCSCLSKHIMQGYNTSNIVIPIPRLAK